jgi:hypothetical protein
MDTIAIYDLDTIPSDVYMRTGRYFLLHVSPMLPIQLVHPRHSHVALVTRYPRPAPAGPWTIPAPSLVYPLAPWTAVLPPEY